MRPDDSDAVATFHRQLEIVEKNFGPESEKAFNPLRYLGQLEVVQKHYQEAESIYGVPLPSTQDRLGDNNLMAVGELAGTGTLVPRAERLAEGGSVSAARGKRRGRRGEWE